MKKCNYVLQDVLEDIKIVELYFNRDEKAIIETDAKYGKLLFKIAYNILGNKSDCEECLNDIYLGIWNTIPPTNPYSFCSFISQIARNIAINKYKENSAKKRIPSEMTISIEDLYNTLQSHDSTNSHFETVELAQLINDYVKGLSKKNRYIFVGKFYMADSIETIAKELGTSTSNIYKSLKKIKQELKEYLERNGVTI